VTTGWTIITYYHGDPRMNAIRLGSGVFSRFLFFYFSAILSRERKKKKKKREEEEG